jgi:hypothetical protein
MPASSLVSPSTCRCPAAVPTCSLPDVPHAAASSLVPIGPYSSLSCCLGHPSSLSLASDQRSWSIPFLFSPSALRELVMTVAAAPAPSHHWVAKLSCVIIGLLAGNLTLDMTSSRMAAAMDASEQSSSGYHHVVPVVSTLLRVGDQHLPQPSCLPELTGRHPPWLTANFPAFASRRRLHAGRSAPSHQPACSPALTRSLPQRPTPHVTAPAEPPPCPPPRTPLEWSVSIPFSPSQVA